MKEIVSSILFLAIAAGLLVGWNHFQKVALDKKDARPSIGALATDTSIVVSKTPVAVVDAVKDEVAEKKSEPTLPSVAKNALDVKVMNGGAPKGTAAKVADVLKKDGYAKVTTGSASGNYTGAVVYYTGANESSAKAISQVLLKEYPQITVQASASSTGETSVSSVVVMIGK